MMVTTLESTTTKDEIGSRPACVFRTQFKLRDSTERMLQPIPESSNRTASSRLGGKSATFLTHTPILPTLFAVFSRRHGLHPKFDWTVYVLMDAPHLASRK